MDNRIFVFISFIIASVVLLALGIATPVSLMPYYIKVLFLLLALGCDCVAFSSRYYTYLIIPMLKQRKNQVVLSNESAYWLSTAADAVLKKVDDQFIATVYVMIPLYRSSTEMSPEEKLDFGRQVSKLVSINRDPVRYSAELYVMNKDAYLQTLRDTISVTENEVIELSQKNAPAKEQERAKGKVAMWRNILDNTNKAFSLELITYASVSAAGSKEFEAVSIAQQKARDLIAGVSSSFGVTPSLITGQDIYKFIEPEHMVPFTTVSEQISRNITQEVI